MKTQSQWDSNVEWYEKNMGEEGDNLNRKIIRQLVLKMLGKLEGKTVLDAGCGSGYLTSELSKTAKKVVGADFSSKFIDLCKKKYSNITNLSFIEYDVTQKSSFEDESFNIILSKMVLQYVPQIETFANEVVRILKKEGQLLVIVDHPFNTQFYFAQQTAGKTNAKYPNLKDYFSKEEQHKLSLWGKAELTWYPKTIADYTMPFVEAGLILKDIQELPEEKEGIRIPRILSLLFKK